MGSTVNDMLLSESDKKLTELILYVSHRSQEDKFFGAVKLNKILFYADFTAYLHYGRPITGAEYMRLEQGPVPKRLLPIRENLIKTGCAALQTVTLASGRIQKRLIALRDADLDLFKASEIEIVNVIIDELKNHSAEQVSELSHNRIWRLARNNDLIPYEAAFISDSNFDESDIARARDLIANHQWNV